MFGGGFSATKLRPQLKMAVSRFQLASNKKTALIKQNMRAVAELLAAEPPQEEKARIKAESLIYDDQHIEAYEILMLECELLLERVKLIEFNKECPPDLVSCVATLIFASTRVDIPELVEIRKQFRSKYGKKFEEAAMANKDGVLNERVVTKLSVDPPAAFLVQTYLEKICEQYEVEWTPKVKLTSDQMCVPMAPPVGYSVHAAKGTGLGMTADTGLNGGQPSIPPPVGTVIVDSSNVSIYRNNQDDDDHSGGSGGQMMDRSVDYSEKRDSFNYNGGGAASYQKSYYNGGGSQAMDRSVGHNSKAAGYNGGGDDAMMASVTGVPEKINVAKGSYYNYEKPAPYAPSVSSASSVTASQTRDEVDNWTRADPTFPNRNVAP